MAEKTRWKKEYLEKASECAKDFWTLEDFADYSIPFIQKTIDKEIKRALRKLRG